MYAGPGGIIMKNTFVLNGLNITIEGQPIAIDKLEVTSEMSAQELATSGGLIKALVGELKPLLSEAIKPVATPATTAVTTPTNNYKNRNNNSYKNNKNYDNKGNYNKPKSITKAFIEMPKPEALEASDQIYKYKNIVTIDGSEYDCIHVHVYAMKRWMHVHVRPNNTSFIGSDIKAEEMEDFLSTIDIPVEIQEYIKKVVALG